MVKVFIKKVASGQCCVRAETVMAIKSYLYLTHSGWQADYASVQYTLTTPKHHSPVD